MARCFIFYGFVNVLFLFSLTWITVYGEWVNAISICINFFNFLMKSPNLIKKSNIFLNLSISTSSPFINCWPVVAIFDGYAKATFRRPAQINETPILGGNVSRKMTPEASPSVGPTFIIMIERRILGDLPITHCICSCVQLTQKSSKRFLVKPEGVSNVFLTKPVNENLG